MRRLGDLTRQQARALAFIGQFIASHGYGPTLTELCAGVGMSPSSKSTMHGRLQRLRRLKYLVTQPRARQSVVLAPRGVAWLRAFGCPVATPSGVASAPSKPSAFEAPRHRAHAAGQRARAGTNSEGRG